MKTSELLEAALYVDMESARNSRYGRDDALDQIRKVWSSKSFYIRDPGGELTPAEISNMVKDAVTPGGAMMHKRQTVAVVKARMRFIQRELKVQVAKNQGKDGSVAWKVSVNHTWKSANARVNEMAEEARAWARKHAKPRKWQFTSHISDEDLRDAYKVINTMSPDAQREIRLRMKM